MGMGRKELFTLAAVCGSLLMAGLPRDKVTAFLHVLGASSVRFVLQPGWKAPVIGFLLYIFTAVIALLFSHLQNVRRLARRDFWVAAMVMLQQQAAAAAARMRAMTAGRTAPAA